MYYVDGKHRPGKEIDEFDGSYICLEEEAKNANCTCNVRECPDVV